MFEYKEYEDFFRYSEIYHEGGEIKYHTANLVSAPIPSKEGCNSRTLIQTNTRNNSASKYNPDTEAVIFYNQGNSNNDFLIYKYSE